MGNVGMIAWVVVLHQLRVLDYSFCYSVYDQQTVFVVSLCGCVCPIVLFVNVFVLCNGTIKMLIVISGFTCLCQCVFLIICNLSSFSGESMFYAAFLSKKLICQILTSKLAPSLVYHCLIRALLSLIGSFALECVQKTVKLLYFAITIPDQTN